MIQNTAAHLRRLPPYIVSALIAVFTVSPVYSAVPVPHVPKAQQGEHCVEETGYMRRNHMDLLKHHRDETVREGVRGKKYSLNQCLTCHAVNGIDDKPVTIKSPKHFCNSCHSYAAVKIDCFDCHASTPGDEKAIVGHKL